MHVKSSVIIEIKRHNKTQPVIQSDEDNEGFFIVHYEYGNELGYLKVNYSTVGERRSFKIEQLFNYELKE
jgi:hypothetical protein